ncbi:RETROTRANSPOSON UNCLASSIFIED-LIKE PROTEIN [Salix viminalis]|uniref:RETROTRANSPOSON UNCLASSIFIED-LIKE PROTEIN n=1 Tax=Salix viminalis TaxID=40686 RepID=A0A9Q0TM39_SALVM|nr:RETROTRANSPOSON UNCLASSIFIED-LIKE PROTEIN [Salix viminalis]
MYEQCSSQKVNSFKSGFILSAKASLSRANVVGGALGFPRIRLPTKYLGMPLYKGPKKSFLWDDLISKIAARMEGWEAQVLSPGGRITILKSILTSMPLYLLHVIMPPKTVMCRIERLFNKFLWSSKGQKRIHWECWEDLCYPIEEGSIGMRRLKDLVKAMSLKLWWRFRTVNNLWSNFMKSKYGYNSASFSGGASVHDSPIWKRLSKAGRAREDLIRWKVGCGKINFWHDIWVDDSALSRYSPPIGESHLLVSSYWRDNMWYLDHVRSIIPNEIVDSLYLITVSSTRVDHPLWTLTANGGFTMYSAWNRVRQVSDRQPIISKIWHASIPLKISFFIWRLLNDFVPMDTRIQKCVAGFGTFLLSRCSLLVHFVDGSIRHRLSHGSSRVIMFSKGKIFQLFQAGLLKRRNWRGDMKLASSFGCHYVLDQVYFPKMVRWIKPKEPCFKLNVDGSFQGRSARSGGGGILRDWHGNVSFYFFLPLKAKSALHAEILTLYHGLRICKDRGISKVWIEMDALSVINLVQNRCIGSWEVCYSLQGIYDCLNSFQFHLSHIYREGNQVADHLAALGSKADNLHIGSSLEDSGFFGFLEVVAASGLLKLLYFFGGLVWPPSKLLFVSSAFLYEDGVCPSFYALEVERSDFHSLYIHPSLLFAITPSGSRAMNWVQRKIYLYNVTFGLHVGLVGALPFQYSGDRADVVRFLQWIAICHRLLQEACLKYSYTGFNRILC